MPDLEAVAERVWYGSGAGAAMARAALAPLAALYGVAMRVRGGLYGSGTLARHAAAVPTISVGNLSVGGTGKTPIAAWVAGELRRRGERPAIVLRGYGGDEPLVHEILDPDAIVVADADRVRGLVRACTLGATAAVLDDAFQHQRAARDADFVLVSADRWTGRAALLPAGPFREPLAALRRATVAVVTRKAADDVTVAAVLDAVHAAAPHVPAAVLRLAPTTVRTWGTDERLALADVDGHAVLAVSAIGDPHAFEAQLRMLGATVQARRFRDHHAFTDGEARVLAEQARAGGLLAVCTLKDAVKLGPRWPAGAQPPRYLTQDVIVERGAGVLSTAIDAALRSRRG